MTVLMPCPEKLWKPVETCPELLVRKITVDGNMPLQLSLPPSFVDIGMTFLPLILLFLRPWQLEELNARDF